MKRDALEYVLEKISQEERDILFHVLGSIDNSKQRMPSGRIKDDVIRKANKTGDSTWYSIADLEFIKWRSGEYTFRIAFPPNYLNYLLKDGGIEDEDGILSQFLFNYVDYLYKETKS